MDSVCLSGSVLTNHWHLEDMFVTRKRSSRNEVYKNLLPF